MSSQQILLGQGGGKAPEFFDAIMIGGGGSGYGGGAGALISCTNTGGQPTYNFDEQYWKVKGSAWTVTVASAQGSSYISGTEQNGTFHSAANATATAGGNQSFIDGGSGSSGASGGGGYGLSLIHI